MQNSSELKDKKITSVKRARKADAMALAQLIYEVYKQEKQSENGIIISGQNNAKKFNIN